MNFFDLHCDTPYECYKKNLPFNKNRLAVSGKSGEIFENWTQTFAIWIKDDAENPFLLYRKILDNFKGKLKNKPSNLTPLFAVEGGAVIETDADRLYSLKNDGVKLLTLTWNGENNLAGGCKTEKGLTTFGKKVIGKMNELKIGCDLSHLNEKSFWDAVESAEYPIATHSNCKSACNHPRNLTDEQIKLIAQKDGIIGLCFYPEFLGEDVFEKLYENISHICNMGFENNIAIGSDFDGAEMSRKLCRISQIPDFYRFLESKGLENKLLDKFFYKNANNFVAILN